ncbi:MAG: hypothetical protein WCS94_23975, partial [Verrucomicrobiota bacterium]
MKRNLHIFGLLLATFLSSFAQSSDVYHLIGGVPADKTLAAVGSITLREPDGPRGVFKHGFRTFNDSAAEWQTSYGVQFEIKLPDARETEITAGIFKYQKETNGYNPPVSATVRVSGKGWHTVTLPWSAFDSERENTGFLKIVKEFRITTKLADGSPVKFELRQPRVVRAPVISLEADILGQAVPQNGVAEYAVTVGNCTEQKQSVSLSFARRGWQSMTAAVEPAALELAPGETKNCVVRMTVSDRVPPGGHEEQTLQAIGNGDAATATQLKFVTASEVPHPFIFHTAARWQEIRDKVAKYDWARAQQEEILKRAANWKVPLIADATQGPDDTYGPYVFPTSAEVDFLACAYAWQLTRDTNAAEKVALFLRRLSNPTNGYPATLR